MSKIPNKGYSCERCGHTWAAPRVFETSNVCPKCKSQYWTILE